MTAGSRRAGAAAGGGDAIAGPIAPRQQRDRLEARRIGRHRRGRGRGRVPGVAGTEAEGAAGGLRQRQRPHRGGGDRHRHQDAGPHHGHPGATKATSSPPGRCSPGWTPRCCKRSAGRPRRSCSARSSAIDTARSQVTQREAEKTAAQAVVAQREAELDAAQRRLARSAGPRAEGCGPAIRRSTTIAPPSRARRRRSAPPQAQVAAAEAAHRRRQVARSSTRRRRSRRRAPPSSASRRISTTARCRSPRDGRVQYRVAQPGEVLSARRAGAEPGRSRRRLHDLLPADASRPAASRWGPRCGSCSMPRPQYVIPAQGQLRRRRRPVHAQDGGDGGGAPEADVPRQGADRPRICCSKHIRDVKTGLPGMAYVRLDPRAEWPAGAAGQAAAMSDRPPTDAPAATAPVVRLRDVGLRYGKTRALDARQPRICPPAAWSG